MFQSHRTGRSTRKGDIVTELCAWRSADGGAWLLARALGMIGMLRSVLYPRSAPTMSILPAPPVRQNRTIVLYLGTTLADYEQLLADGSGHPALNQRVELADSLNWGHLADGHAPACPRHLHFTPHHHYSR